MTLKMPLGPVMVDVPSTKLTEGDIKRLTHPLTGGMILFARNYESPEQLKALTASIRALRTPELLIAVDHEGGRVQRFREGFTPIPPMRTLGERWNESQEEALRLAYNVGQVIGAEMVLHGIDFSFTPVLDVDWGESGVIGNRAFHVRPSAITALARELIRGLAWAGVPSVGKHFPGHGFVRADSHLEIPVDERTLDQIWESDLIPFRELSRDGMNAVMPAHIIYPEVDKRPAGFSQKWLQEVLRERLGFEGVIFSDDLTMEGASVMGNENQRAHAALKAGCDMVLLCNNQYRADLLLASLTADGLQADPASSKHLESMQARGTVDMAQYEAAKAAIAGLGLD